MEPHQIDYFIFTHRAAAFIFLPPYWITDYSPVAIHAKYLIKHLPLHNLHYELLFHT